MTLKEYALHRGVSPPAVTNAIKRGHCPFVIQDGKKFVDSEEADSTWVKSDVGHPVGKKAAKSEKSIKIDQKKNTILDSKATKEEIGALMARLEYDERIGLLVPASQVKKEAAEAALMVKNKMNSLPDRVAAEFAGETSQYVIHKRLKEELSLIQKSLFEENT